MALPVRKVNKIQCPFYFRLNSKQFSERANVFCVEVENAAWTAESIIQLRAKVKKNAALGSLSFLWFGWWAPTVGIVSGGQQHGEEYQQWYQQVGNVDRDQQQALLQRLGTSSGCHWELMKHDVAQDGHQRGGHMNRIHNGRHPNPLTATCKMIRSV